MLWNVDDNGKVMMKLTSVGKSAAMINRDEVNRFIANIVSDLSVNMGVDIVTNELRVSFSKVRPEVNVTWRAQVAASQVPDVREYMTRIASTEAPGE